MKVAVVDYQAGNLDSVCRALGECGADPWVAAEPRELERAERIVLPGVGSFAAGMQHLRDGGWIEGLEQEVRKVGIPFLGICLGMQLMARSGEEGGGAQGLGWIDAQAVRLAPERPGERVPHMGWNEVHWTHGGPLMQKIDDGRDFYFVHSYHLRCARPEDVLATTPYCGGFASVVGRDGVWGVQFHPEKSQKPGFQLLRNFLAC